MVRLISEVFIWPLEFFIFTLASFYILFIKCFCVLNCLHRFIKLLWISTGAFIHLLRSLCTFHSCCFGALVLCLSCAAASCRLWQGCWLLEESDCPVCSCLWVSSLIQGSGLMGFEVFLGVDTCYLSLLLRYSVYIWYSDIL